MKRRVTAPILKTCSKTPIMSRIDTDSMVNRNQTVDETIFFIVSGRQFAELSNGMDISMITFVWKQTVSSVQFETCLLC